MHRNMQLVTEERKGVKPLAGIVNIQQMHITSSIVNVHDSSLFSSISLSQIW